MKTRSAAVLLALAFAGASGCGPGLEPPKASSRADVPTGVVVDHGGVPGIAGSGAAAAGTGAASGLAGAGGGAAGAAGSSVDAGVDDDAGN